MRSTKVNTRPDQQFCDLLLLPIAVGIVLRQVREAKHLTQADLAIQANMNLSYISNVENGQNNISILKFSLICGGLDVEAHAVLRRAHELVQPLNIAIRNRTPREAERLIRYCIPELLNVDAIVAISAGAASDPESLRELESAARRRLR